MFASPEQHYRMRAEFRVWHTEDDMFYAMFERALLYDWALFKGEFSLTERSDRLLPHVLDVFVKGI